MHPPADPPSPSPQLIVPAPEPPLRPTTVLGQAVYRLVAHDDGPCTLHSIAGRDLVVLAPGKDGWGAVLVVPRSGAEAEQKARVKALRRQLPFKAVIVALGGGEAARRVASKSSPWRTAARQRWLHVDDDGALHGEATGTPIARRLGAGATLGSPAAAPDPDAWQRFVERVERDAARAVESAMSIERFNQLRAANKPLATIGILALMVIVFALEVMWDATESIPTLVRMGGLKPERVADGEYYRMLSVALLHGDFKHILFNGYVIWVLGSFLEQVIGSIRFVVLLVGSIIGGSIASMLFMDVAVSVGISGGLWGVLAAHAVLAWMPGGPLPNALVPQARRMAVINLGLNIVVSFLPNIDWAAHAGGAIVGAGLMVAVLTRGLPDLDALPPGAEPGEIPRPAPAITGAAALLGLALFASAPVALLDGQPWTLRTPAYASVTTDDGVTYDMPSQLAPNPDGPKTLLTSVVYGDIFTDPAQCDVATVADTIEPAALAEALRGGLPAGTTITRDPAVGELAGAPAVTLRAELPNGIQLALAFKFGPPVGSARRVHRVECAIWPRHPAWSDVAERIATSMNGPGGG